VTTVAAVIAAFEPGPELMSVVEYADSQVDSVIVVDDGSPSRLRGGDGRVAEVLESCADAGVTVIESPENSGIAHALNTGVCEALRSGADIVLTLDQDTRIGDGYVDRAVAHLELARSVGIVDAVASPSVINDDVAPFWFAEKGLTLAFEPIQSGLMIPRGVFDKVGLFDESLFIDCVETEFYLRARAHGVHALVVPGTRIVHRLGTRTSWTPPRPLRWLLRGRGQDASIGFSEHAPFRHYYITRNRLVLYRRYARTEPLWCAVSVMKDTAHRARSMAVGSDRCAQMYMSAVGVWAAISGDIGKVPERTLRRSERL
jgi:GT2 family glycosyltransferase